MPNNNPEKKATRVDLLITFFKNNPFTAIIIVFCLALIGFSNATESGEKLLRSFGIIKKYDVNLATERGRFSWDLIESAWNRMFWMRNYTERVRKRASADDQAKSWQKLMDATEKWSTELMNYYIGLDTYYQDSHKRDTLEVRIVPSINSAMQQIVDLRYTLSSLDSLEVENRVKKIQDSISEINIALYRFVDQKPIGIAEKEKKSNEFGVVHP